MATPDQKDGSNGPRMVLTDADLHRALENLQRALSSYDEYGEQGLQAALDHIYPPSGLVRRRTPELNNSFEIRRRNAST